MTVPGPEDAVQTVEPVAPKPGPAQPEKPRRAEVRDDEEDEDRPRRRSRRDDEDDEDDDRPRRRRRSRYEDDEDDEDDHRRREPPQTSGKAVATLVLGLLTFCTGLAAIPAIILGIMGLVEIGRSRGRLGGKGLAIAGLVTTALGGACFVFILAFSVLGVREAAARMVVQNNMKQMVLGMQNHNDQFGHLPDPYPDPKRGPVRSKLSWRVQLLPYLEQDNLYRQFHHDEPWDSPHNKKLIAQMPKVFSHPKHPEADAQGLTYYRVFTGPMTPFPPGRLSRIPADFTDGTSNTILIVEAADPVPWTKPDELVYDPQKPLPRLGGHFRGGTVVGMADGMTRIVGPGVSEQTLRAAITASGGEVLGRDW
jgi:hypothetical protein